MKRPDENIAQRELRDIIGRGRRSPLRQRMDISEPMRLSVHSRCVGQETTQEPGGACQRWIFSDGSALSHGPDGWNASERHPSHAEQWLALKTKSWNKHVAAAAAKGSEWKGGQEGGLVRFYDGSAIINKGDGWALDGQDGRRALPPGQSKATWLGIWKNEMHWTKPPERLSPKERDDISEAGARWLVALDKAGRSLIERALDIEGLDLRNCYCAASSSFYLIFEAGSESARFNVRLSGHHQRYGGGWHISREQRMGSADIDIVLLDGDGTFAKDQEGPLDIDRAITALAAYAKSSAAPPATSPSSSTASSTAPRTTTASPRRRHHERAAPRLGALPKRRYP